MSEPNQRPIAHTLVGWAILALPLLLFILLFINPVIHTLSLSGMNWNGLGEPRPGGAENMMRLFFDERFWSAWVNTFFSPLLLVRILLLVAAPLSLSLLFMELRSGPRLTFQAVLAPLVFFSGAAVNSVAFTGRVASGMALFSIPMLAAYLLAGLNGLLLPLTMSLRPETQTLPLALMRLRGEYTFGATSGMQAWVGIASLLQYLIPCVLLVVSVLIVFPRLAFVMRKKGEAIPALSPEVVKRMKN